MAVKTINEDWSRRSMTVGRNGRTATRVFQGDTDSATDGELTIYSDGRFPQYGESHPEDSLLTVAERRVVRVAPTFWEMLVKYQDPDGSTGNRQSPLDEPMRISWETSSTTEPIDTDQDENPIVNKAGQLFDPPITAQFHDAVVVVTKNQSSFDPDVIVEYTGAVSSDEFMGQPAGTAMMLSIRATKIEDDSFTYWQVTYRVQFRRPLPGQDTAKAWYRRILNAGTMKLSSNNLLVNIKDEVTGQPVTQPVPISQDGKSALLSTQSPIWLDFEIHPSKPFAPLGIG